MYWCSILNPTWSATRIPSQSVHLYTTVLLSTSISEMAFVVSTNAPYLLSQVCSVLIKSEVHLLSHLRGKQHETAIGGRELSEEERNSINLKNIVDAPEGEADPRLLAAKERVKAAKRRAKKVS